jgi:hypothetical protein
MPRREGRSPGMAKGPRRLVVAVRPGRSARHAREVLRWARCMLPAAILFVGPPAARLADAADDVIAIDADAVRSGPLSLADALFREHERADPRRRERTRA